MKKIVVLVAILSVAVLCNCFRSISDTSSLVEKGDNIYLFGAATGKDGTSIICRFTCTNIPTQQNKKELCSSPTYITESELSQFQNLTPFLDYIKSSRIKVRTLEQNTQNTVNSVFTSAESSNKTSDSIGEPSEVCSSALEADSGSVVSDSSSSDSSSDSNIPTGIITEIQSLDEIKEGYPTLVMYGNIKASPPCTKEYYILERNQAKFAGKMHIYNVAIEKNNFPGNITPCGGGIPQNQIFDANKNQVSCEAGFGNSTKNYIKQLGISLE